MLPSYLHHRFIARFLDSITISSEFATYSGSCNPIKFGRGGRVGGGGREWLDESGSNLYLFLALLSGD